MKKWIILLCFIIALALNIIGECMNYTVLQYLTKPLLMPLLALHFISQLKNSNSPLMKWVLFALLFSLAGDVLLMFQDKQSIYFLLGLSSFLLAQVFYILFFFSIKRNEKISFKMIFIVAVIAFYTVLFYFIYPGLGEMKLPVMVYGVVICGMLLFALHTVFLKNKIAGLQMASGALFFVLSDSLIAINKFYQPLNEARILIMITYGIAQLLIVLGAVNYIRTNNK